MLKHFGLKIFYDSYAQKVTLSQNCEMRWNTYLNVQYHFSNSYYKYVFCLKNDKNNTKITKKIVQNIILQSFLEEFFI